MKPILLLLHHDTVVCRVEELTLINEHLQQQLGESQAKSDRLSGDVHRLSISLSETQNRTREVETQHKQHIAVSFMYFSILSSFASVSLVNMH